MSLRDDLDTAADVSEILAYQQRADILAAQTAQLAALRDLRDHAQIQSLRAEREKTLQDTLFSLRRSLPAIAGTINGSPQKAASDVVLAEQTLLLVPPEAFSSLEWKELSLTVRNEMDGIISRLVEQHGDLIVRELAELRDAARVVAAEERARFFKERQQREEAVQRRKDRDGTASVIYATIVIVIVVGFLIFFLSRID